MNALHPPKTGRPKVIRPQAKVRVDQRLAANIVAKLSSKNLTQADLAEYLEIDKSSLVRALQHPHRLRPRLDRIAEFLDVVPGSLLSARAEPAEAADEEESGGQELRESFVARCFMTVDDGGRLAMPPGCMLWQLPASEQNRLTTPSITVLCAPGKASPASGDLVLAETKDGRVWLRLFGRDQRDPDFIVLSPHLPGDGPLSVRESELVDLRLVAGIVALGGAP